MHSHPRRPPELAEDAKKPRTAREAKMSKRERKLSAKEARLRFAGARKAEHDYARRLRHLARTVGQIILGYAPRGIVGDHLAAITRTLDQYAFVIEPWARAVGARMLADVNRRDANLWMEHSAEMGLLIRDEIRNTPTGDLMRQLEQQQVDLITSIPRKAAERVHRIAQKMLEGGERSDSLRDEIMRSTHVEISRADLIAYTETARAASNFTQARAQHIGSATYIWRTAQDGNVRNIDGNPIGSHRLLNGKTFRWDTPPVASTNGARANPGCIYRCRCIAEPIIPLDL